MDASWLAAIVMPCSATSLARTASLGRNAGEGALVGDIGGLCAGLFMDASWLAAISSPLAASQPPQVEFCEGMRSRD